MSAIQCAAWPYLRMITFRLHFGYGSGILLEAVAMTARGGVTMTDKLASAHSGDARRDRCTRSPYPL